MTVVNVAFDPITLRELLKLPPGSEIVGATIRQGTYRSVLWLKIANDDLPESANEKEAQIDYIRIESEFVVE